MRLTEIFFIASSTEDADALAELLNRDGYRARVVAGDGSGTVWQVRAYGPPVPDFRNQDEAERFIEETLQPLAQRFGAAFGGTLSDDQAASGFAFTPLDLSDQATRSS
jgi:hypothetical protein